MKRTKPLQGDPAKARAWQDRSRAKASAKARAAQPRDRQPRTRIKPRSAKRERDMVERRALVTRLLRERERCEAQWKCQGARAVDVHERLKRSRGGNILDPVQAHMITVCRACHEATEAEVAEATQRRLLIPSWHVCPPVGPC